LWLQYFASSLIAKNTASHTAHFFSMPVLSLDLSTSGVRCSDLVEPSIKSHFLDPVTIARV
jgi:hypothetical protein